ncbi:MAG: hypothetical protein LUQ43_12945 [Methanoregula sp.]|nr:hypothetical protein [Methanoregula sp.]
MAEISDYRYKHQKIIRTSIQRSITWNKHLEIFIVLGSSREIKALVNLDCEERD